MSIADVKEQVSSILAEKRSGGLARGGQMGLDKPAVPLKTVAIGGVIGLAAFLVLPRMFAPPTTASRADTGNAQIDQAMQMLQQQQDINQKLLQGQQELNSQMIEAQSRAKTVQPSVNCILAVCPGTAKQEAAPDSQYAIVGEGIRTARIDPNQFMQGMMQQPAPPASQQPAPQLPPTQPATAAVPIPNAVSVSADPVESEYRRLSELWINDPQRFYNLAWQYQDWVTNRVPGDVTAVALNRFFDENPGQSPYAVLNRR